MSMLLFLLHRCCYYYHVGIVALLVWVLVFFSHWCCRFSNMGAIAFLMLVLLSFPWLVWYVPPLIPHASRILEH